MQHSLSRISVLAWLMAIAGWQPLAILAQQTQVLVNAGQTLTDTELTAGTFLGQDFDLAPDTVFEIEAGGVLGPVSDRESNQPFDFGGATANINSGGQVVGPINAFNRVENLTLNVREGGAVTNLLAGIGSTINLAGGTTDFVEVQEGSTLNVTSGIIPFSSRATDSTVHISGGSVGRSLFLSGSVADVSGGTVGKMEASNGSTINVSGGTLQSYSIGVGSTLNLTGGRLIYTDRAAGTLNASGGTIGRRFVGTAGTTFTGGEFTLNGSRNTGDIITFPASGQFIFSGTFADGTPFVFSQYQGDQLTGVKLVSSPLPTADTTPIVVDGSSAPAPNGLRRGQSLTLNDGGTLNAGTAVVGAMLVVEGGHVGDTVDAYQSEVHLRSGSIDHNFHLLPGSRLDMSGGTVGGLQVFDGSTTTVSGGRVAGPWHIRSGASVSVSGGSIGNGFNAESNWSDVSFAGGEFQLNGASYTDDSITLGSNDTFTGTFQDGSPFVFSSGSRTFDRLRDVRLISAPLPAKDLNPILVSQADDRSPTGLRAGQMLTLQGDGTLPENFESVDATLNINGGTVGDSLRLAGGVTNITAGQVGDATGALFGSTVNISGGSVGNHFQAGVGSTVNITGGSVGGSFTVGLGSTLNLSGGSIGTAFRVDPEATFNLFGGEFLLNGEPYTQDTLPNLDLSEDVFSGTLADGTTFVFASRFPDPRLPDRIAHANLISAPLPEIDLSPIVVDAISPSPNGLRAGQTLTLQPGGSLPRNFAAIGGTLVVNGGTVGADMQLVATDMDITGGTVDSNLGVRVGSKVHVADGDVKNLLAYSGATVSITGGRIDAVGVTRDGVLNISGGSIGFLYMRTHASVLNISGGTIDGISAPYGTMNLTVTDFLIDGVPAMFQPGAPLTFRTEHSPLYSALLPDGSRLDFTWSGVRSGTIINVWQVPEPSAVRLLVTAIAVAMLTKSRRCR